MKFKSFFWQVFFALAILCFGSILLYRQIEAVVPTSQAAILITLIPALAVGFFMAYRLSRPLEALRHHLKKMAEGDISDRMRTLRTDLVEIHELAAAMEKVRDQLQKRIQTILAQKNELDALLRSMSEGVVAIDDHDRVLQINEAAGLILGVSPREALGQKMQEVIRIPEVFEVVNESLQKNQMQERDIHIEGYDKKYLQLHSSPMRMTDGDRLGVVLVFSDVTRLRELEGMRKNFVANVSHELRTPLTSIQGFAETLLDPSVKDPGEIKKFLEIIRRHASRLGRIIEDILVLSRIERDGESHQIDLKEDFLKPTLMAAVELCQIRADKKKIMISLDCSDHLRAPIDPYLLEQAIVNLIDNAIRYSDEGHPIEVKAQEAEKEILIQVKDSGVGIAEKHLPRIFERFYRVDKARSRELGGTGLGLSLVKHICLAHKGYVEAQSRLGVGSTFTIHLPGKN